MLQHQADTDRVILAKYISSTDSRKRRSTSPTAPMGIDREPALLTRETLTDKYATKNKTRARMGVREALEWLYAHRSQFRPPGPRRCSGE